MTAKIRLYVDQPLSEGQKVSLNREQAHYLFGVMRRPLGDNIALFNGYNGEWSAKIVEAQKRAGSLRCINQKHPQQNPPDLWFLFAPVKKTRTDFIVEKAAELGAARIMPIKTEFTNSERISQKRLQSHVISAAEQCGGTFVPTVDNLQRLDKVMTEWPAKRNILFCDENKVGMPVRLSNLRKGKWAILIGPEGGFSQKERSQIVSISRSYSISLGPRILRADTAAVAALTLWQNKLGDWA